MSANSWKHLDIWKVKWLLYFDIDLLQGVMRILETNVHPEEGLRRAILCSYNSEIGLEKLHFVTVCHLSL